jgi:hypothetical protein
MSEGHIDQATIQGLLSGGLHGAATLAVAEHLDAGCDACEALLAEDGEVDAVLLALAQAQASGAAGNDLEWARIRRRLRGGSPLRGLRVAAAVLLVAGATFAVVQAIRPMSRDGWDGQKGVETQPVGARLRFSVAPGSIASGVERGASGAVLSPEASLLFRVEAAGPTRLVLVHLAPGSGAAPEVIWEGEAAAAGTLDVEVDGRPAAFPLHGLSGPQRFALLAAPGLDRPRVDEALRRLAAGPEAPAPALPISLDVVEVTVR